jgi:hypothetical protein
MAGMRARTRAILLERERKEAAAREATERLISRGLPTGSGIPFEAWRSWHRHGFIVCPASKGRHTCSNPCLGRLATGTAAAYRSSLWEGLGTLLRAGLEQ